MGYSKEENEILKNVFNTNSYFHGKQSNSFIQRLHYDLVVDQDIFLYDKNNYQFYMAYQDFVKEIAEFVKTHAFKENMISQILWIDYLIHQGIFSVDKKFRFGDPDILDVSNEIATLRGRHVIKGIGCCRHISSLTSEILKQFGFQYSAIVGVLGMDQYPYAFNHMNNIIQYKGMYYIVDLTNHYFLFISKKNSETEGFTAKDFITYTREHTFVFEPLRLLCDHPNCTEKDVLKLYKSLLLQIDNEYIAKEELAAIKNETFKRVVQSKMEIEDFEHQIQEKKQKIVQLEKQASRTLK